MNNEHSNLGIGGAVVFWKMASKTDHDELCGGLGDLGLHDFMPDPRKPLSLLKEALGLTFDAGCYLIRPLASKDGYAVVKEEKGKDENQYEHIGSATVSDDDRISTSCLSYEDEEKIKLHYRDVSGHVTGSQVTQTLLKILTRLGGVTLRPSGAVYWLPLESLPEWEHVVKVVENAACKGEAMVHVMQVTFDESSVRAIAEGLIEDVTNEADAIIGQLQGGKLKDNTLRKRLEQATTLRAKVESYELALGKSLTKLHAKLDEIEVAQSMGTIMANAEVAEVA
jgi:hypothetical protein